MMKPFNFAAGPSTIPPEVLVEVQKELIDWRGSGVSVLEMPFTGPEFSEILEETVTGLRDLLEIPWNYHVLLMQGGAYGQFAAMPMNLLRGRTLADYVVTGHWSQRAAEEARRYCTVNIAASSASEGFTSLPAFENWTSSDKAAYCHITTNETANGVQFHDLPDTTGIPLVADMTSDFLTRPFDISRFGAVYASAQKNVGPAGLTIVIVREDLLGDPLPITPSVCDFGRLAANSSKVNTPPVFSVYVTGKMLKWLQDRGGLAAAQANNKRKADMLYAAIDESDHFSCLVDKGCRSQTTPCFFLTEKNLEKLFLREAEEAGLLNLKGHPATGGIRAALFNAVPLQAVESLASFIRDFDVKIGTNWKKKACLVS